MKSGSVEQATTFPWIVAITGASGTVYGRRLLEVIAQRLPQLRVEAVVSDAAWQVMAEEDGLDFGQRGERPGIGDLLGFDCETIRIHDNRDIGANIASGSYRTSGMIICPCSMATLAAISVGLSDTLIHRAADVQLKEGRKLIIVPRETPLSAIHLANMLKLSRLGVTVLPAMPGFYHRPNSIGDLVDMLVMRMLDHMGLSAELEGSLVPRWKDGNQ